jgi:hypothetical protein
MTRILAGRRTKAALAATTLFAVMHLGVQQPVAAAGSAEPITQCEASVDGQRVVRLAGAVMTKSGPRAFTLEVDVPSAAVGALSTPALGACP